MATMEIYKALGGRVASLRRELGLTQMELAHRLGVSRASVASIEAGRQKVVLDQAYALAGALELGKLSDLISMDVPRRERAAAPLPAKFSASPIQAAQIDGIVRSAVASARSGTKKS
jgi:transcriptional regulator with XRE-family HTH domain